MMPNEVAQLRTMAEVNRRLRRENEHLRESILLEAKKSKAFDDENVELFDVVHRNHAVRR
jgi:regulator of replication initiation timing